MPIRLVRRVVASSMLAVALSSGAGQAFAVAAPSTASSISGTLEDAPSAQVGTTIATPAAATIRSAATGSADADADRTTHRLASTGVDAVSEWTIVATVLALGVGVGLTVIGRRRATH